MALRRPTFIVDLRHLLQKVEKCRFVSLLQHMQRITLLNVLSYTANITFLTLLAFHIYTHLPNIKLHLQIFTTDKLVQFCVSKSTHLNFISLVRVQLASNRNDVAKSLHPVLIRRLSINWLLFVTQSEYHVKYIQPLFNSSNNFVHLTQLNSSESFCNVPTILKQFHSTLLLRNTLQHGFVYRHTVLSLCFHCNTIVPCLTSNNTAYSDQHTVLILLCQCICLNFSKATGLEIKFITSKISLLTRDKIITQIIIS